MIIIMPKIVVASFLVAKKTITPVHLFGVYLVYVWCILGVYLLVTSSKKDLEVECEEKSILMPKRCHADILCRS